MSKQNLAVTHHLNGFNCAQAVINPFSEQLGLDERLAMRLASGFGAGMRCGDMCGAVTGALMVLGLFDGQEYAHEQNKKHALNEQVTLFHQHFKSLHHTNICRELLGYDMTSPVDKKVILEKNLSRTKCDVYIADAVAIIEQMMYEAKG